MELPARGGKRKKKAEKLRPVLGKKDEGIFYEL